MRRGDSGALTFGQLSMLGKVCLHVANLIGAAGASYNLSDLTTDRLFRVLQYVEVKGVQYLSVSGSYVNRFSRLIPSDFECETPVGKLGARFELPNDGIVEDESVDLEEAVLPAEIYALHEQYEHVRCYKNCGSVSHSGVHASAEVRRLLVAKIRQWCGTDTCRW